MFPRDQLSFVLILVNLSPVELLFDKMDITLYVSKIKGTLNGYFTDENYSVVVNLHLYCGPRGPAG